MTDDEIYRHKFAVMPAQLDIRALPLESEAAQSYLELADRLLFDPDIEQGFLDGRIVTFGVKPNLDRFYPNLQGVHAPITDLTESLLGSRLRNFSRIGVLDTVPIVMSPQDVRDFYVHAPWQFMEVERIHRLRLADGTTVEVSEAELFTSYMSGGRTIFGFAESDARIIELLRARLGESTSPAKAYRQSLESGLPSIRAHLGKPIDGVSPWEEYIFLNGMHLSSSPEEALREARLIAEMIKERLVLNHV